MNAATDLEAWCWDLFAVIDTKDAERFVEFLSPDAEFRFGSAPAVCGRAAIRDAVAGFFDTISRTEHTLLRTWADGATRVCQGEVTYTRHDGSRLSLPFVNVFEMAGEAVERYLIYIDIAPLYEPAEAG